MTTTVSTTPRFMTIFVGCLLALALTATPAAAAKLTASTVIQAEGGGQRIIVTLTSSKSPGRKKPRSVKVKAAGKTVSLKRFKASASAAAAGYSSTWRSKIFTGDYANQLAALNGASVKVTIKSKSGKTNLNSTVVIVNTGGGGGGGGGGGTGGGATGPVFAPPPAPLIGNDAFNYLSKWFLNSAFSDCQYVWPTCAVEQRYVHCPSGAWEYHRNTPSSGSDIHAYDNFTVNGANVNADGSWVVSYVTGTGGSYNWSVNVNGIATGQYQFGSNLEALGPSYWSQPAITWQEPNGAC